MDNETCVFFSSCFDLTPKENEGAFDSADVVCEIIEVWNPGWQTVSRKIYYSTSIVIPV